MCDIFAHYMLIGGSIMYFVSYFGYKRFSICCSLAEKGHITLCSDRGGGRIFVISLHYTTKKRPSLHYHNLQQC